MPSKSDLKKKEAELRKIKSSTKTAERDLVKKQRAAAEAHDPKKSKKAALKLEAKRAATKAVLSSSSANDSVKRSSAASAGIVADTDDRPEPPFSYEIHVKNAQLLVNVTLHRVPPQCIDISATNRTTLIVDCSKHTKRYFLRFSLPHKITIEPDACEYSYDDGVLHCTLPMAGGRVPDVAKEERDKLISKVVASKALRFRQDTDGDVVVRTRRAMLPVDHASSSSSLASAANAAAMRHEKDQKLEHASGSGSPRNDQKFSSSNSSKESNSDQGDRNDNSTMPSTSHRTNAAPVSDTQMLQLAESIGQDKKKTTNKKIQQAQQKQQHVATKKAVGDSNRSLKKEQEASSFRRVIAEQQRRLADRLAMAAPKPRTGSSTKKSVTFDA